MYNPIRVGQNTPPQYFGLKKRNGAFFFVKNAPLRFLGQNTEGVVLMLTNTVYQPKIARIH